MVLRVGDVKAEQQQAESSDLDGQDFRSCSNQVMLKATEKPIADARQQDLAASAKLLATTT